eukprot:CAMPEP_0167817898 /NCGR_PEP_ID=MMETSP0112_2-20121227/4493_1 /TAXON_ID=91324 /ORGANISM="Lotharella globosa, Strain CCCM811" /LENGTH=193 /DNA_ID=CAMNT_0007717799 /DNA_START=167 /DNA_END=748 /DNA_ORIENTATION=-
MYLSRISHSSGCAVIEFVVTLVSCSQGKVEGLEVVEGSHVKVKGYLMMKGRPAMCVKMSTAKPGKHGHVKCNIVGQDLLKPDKKYQHMCPGHEAIEVPVVKKYELELSDVEKEEGKGSNIECLVTMNDDAEEIKITYNGEDPLHKEAVDKWNEIEESGADDKVVVLSILQATVGEKGKYDWEYRVEKVNVKTD